MCTEAGMYAIRARRKTVTEKDFLDAVQKVCAVYTCKTDGSPVRHVINLCANSALDVTGVQVIKGFAKFSATPAYMVR